MQQRQKGAAGLKERRKRRGGTAMREGRHKAARCGITTRSAPPCLGIVWTWDFWDRSRLEDRCIHRQNPLRPRARRQRRAVLQIRAAQGRPSAPSPPSSGPKKRSCRICKWRAAHHGTRPQERTRRRRVAAPFSASRQLPWRWDESVYEICSLNYQRFSNLIENLY